MRHLQNVVSPSPNPASNVKEPEPRTESQLAPSPPRACVECGKAIHFPCRLRHRRCAPGIAKPILEEGVIARVQTLHRESLLSLRFSGSTVVLPVRTVHLPGLKRAIAEKDVGTVSAMLKLEIAYAGTEVKLSLGPSLHPGSRALCILKLRTEVWHNALAEIAAAIVLAL